MRFSNTVLSYGSQRPMLPIVYVTRLTRGCCTRAFSGTMLTSREIDGLEITPVISPISKSDDSHNSGLKALTFGGASYQFNDQLSGALRFARRGRAECASISA